MSMGWHAIAGDTIYLEWVQSFVTHGPLRGPLGAIASEKWGQSEKHFSANMFDPRKL